MAIPKKDMVKRKYHERKERGLVPVSVWVPSELKHLVKELEKDLNDKYCKDSLCNATNE